MAVRRRPVAVACVVLALSSLTACSKDDKPAASSSTSPSSSSATSSSSSGSSSSSSSPGVCGATPKPAAAVAVTDAPGDFNGDRAIDTLSVFGTGTDAQPGPYHVHVALGADKGDVDDVIPDAPNNTNSVVKALGGSDITASAGLPPDGSGDEVFVTIGSGAAASLVAVFQLLDCQLIRLTNPQGQPSAFAVGGSVTHLDGLRCDGTAGGVRLVQLSATSDDGITYATTELRLQVQNGQLTVANTVNDSINSSDARLQQFASIDCPGVAVP